MELGTRFIHNNTAIKTDKMAFKKFFLLAILYVQYMISDSIRNSNIWMKDIPDSKKLCQLLIPGTHNSGSHGTLLGIGKTQDWSVKEQLENRIPYGF